MAPSYSLRPHPAHLVEAYRRAGMVTDETAGVLLQRAADRLPHHEALVDLSGPEPRRFTYSAALGQVERFAAWLRSQGVGPGDLVMLQGPNAVELVLGAWAAWRAGAASTRWSTSTARTSCVTSWARPVRTPS